MLRSSAYIAILSCALSACGHSALPASVTARQANSPSKAGALAVGNAPGHAPTMAYVGGSYGYDPGPNAVQQNIDIAQFIPPGHIAPSGGNVDCPVGSSCAPMDYMDETSIYCQSDTIGWFNAANTPLNESWFLHTSSPISPSNRVQVAGGPGKCPGGVSFYSNLGNAASQAYWLQFLQLRVSASNQMLFFDDASWYFNHGHVYEYPTIDAMRQAEASAMDALAPTPLMCNCLGTGGGYYGTGNPSPGGTTNYAVDTKLLTTYTHAGNLKSGLFEAPLYHADGVYRTVNARIVINSASQILANSNKSIAMLDYVIDANGAPNDQARRLHTGLIWLIAGDQLSRVISWEASAVNNTNIVAVFPEQQLYVKNPVTQMGAYAYNAANAPNPESPFGNGSGCRFAPGGKFAKDAYDRGGVDDLAVACGTDTGGNPAAVYVREYADCYQGVSGIGNRFGGCAVIFNATNAPVTISASWFTQSFAHAIGWSGGEIPQVCPIGNGCNGQISLTATAAVPGTTKVPANDAMLLSP